MRTTILTTLLIATIGYTLTAQVMGNYGVQQQTYNNVNLNVQYRAVPKAAQLLGNNNIQITINALCNRDADSQSMEGNDKNAVYNNVDKPISRFYNAIPATDYDIVINPELLEPAVQFSYNLVFLFTLPERKIPTKTEVQKEVILITPSGEMRTLKIE